MKRIQLYVLNETVFPFIISLSFFIFIFLIDKVGDLIDLFLNKGVSLPVVLTLLLYILPAFVAISVPMAFLFAIIFATSRLSGDNEIIAIKNAGINMKAVLLPLIILSLIISGVMIKFNDTLLPRANYEFKSLIYNIVKKRAAVLITPKVYITRFPGFKIYVDKFNKKKDILDNIFIIRKTKQKETLIVTARTGKLIKDNASQNIVFKLSNGVIQSNEQGEKDFLTLIRFKEYNIYLHLGGIAEKIITKGYREMNFKEMASEIRKRKKEGLNYSRLVVELQKKIAIPFASFVFVLVGVPLGIYKRRSGQGLSVVASIVLIFVYYLILMLGQSLGDRGLLNPVVAIWLPNIFFFGLGSIMTYNILRR